MKKTMLKTLRVRKDILNLGIKIEEVFLSFLRKGIFFSLLISLIILCLLVCVASLTFQMKTLERKFNNEVKGLRTNLNIILFNTKLHYLGSAKVTWFTNHPSETKGNPNLMASGNWVYEGAIAVSRDWILKNLVVRAQGKITKGTVFYIPELKRTYTVECLMAEKNPYTDKKQEEQADIFIWDRKEAFQKGVKWCHIYLVLPE